MRSQDATRYRANWQEEVDSAAQYRAMAEGEPDPRVAKVYLELAQVEDKHARFWVERLHALGVDPGPARPSWRARVLSWAARKLGAQYVLPTVASREYVGRNAYLAHPEANGTSMNAQERTHARVLGAMLARSTGASGREVARVEGRHRSASGNALRAAVLGANDGLCSNLSLVMGVAGASTDSHTILLSGAAGLLAGAASMAIGEWISVTSSRELAEREMSVERDELEASPEQEREELQLIYEAKGLPTEEARQLSHRLLDKPEEALDILAREELGIDPKDLGGSARTAAATSFLLFAIGAVFPVAPFVFLRGRLAIGVSLLCSSLALYAIGAAITIFTNKPVWRSGGRQLVLGLAAAGVTFALGRALGVALA